MTDRLWGLAKIGFLGSQTLRNGGGKREGLDYFGAKHLIDAADKARLIPLKQTGPLRTSGNEGRSVIPRLHKNTQKVEAGKTWLHRLWFAYDNGRFQSFWLQKCRM